VRIVHLNPFYFPYAGGIERRIRAVSRRLGRKHEVHVVTAQQPGGPGGTEVEEGGPSTGGSASGPFTVHRLPSRFHLRRLYNPPLVSTPGLQDYIRRLAPDLVDYHFRWSPGYNKAFRSLSCAGVITYHNTYGEGRGLLGVASRANDRLFMRTLRHAQRVVCVSEGLRRDLASHGADAALLRVSHNAVETDDIEAVRGPPALEVPRPFVVTVGRAVALKGFDILVRAWRQVPEPLDLVVVGQGPEIPALRRLAQREGVADRVHFPGWVDEEEKVRLLKAAVAYAHPSRFEAFGLSVLEAMAAGAPVVCAKVGGIPEVVGDAGPLLGHTPGEWAGALGQLALAEGLRSDLARRSRQRARLFHWDRITEGLEVIYAEAVTARG